MPALPPRPAMRGAALRRAQVLRGHLGRGAQSWRQGAACSSGAELSAPAATAARLRLRQLFAEERVVVPASVFDPLSARMAQRMDYPAVQLAGSVASNAVLGAPDLMLLSVTELAALCRRITRAAPRLPLIVDADDGYGNALGVARCVDELENAGVSALSIEDSVLPARYGSTGQSLKGSAGGYELTSVDEGVGRIRAAVAARSDLATVIIARTSAYTRGGVRDLCDRVTAYVAAGAHAVHVIGQLRESELPELQGAAKGLPIMLSGPQVEEDSKLAARGVRLRLAGHLPFLAAQQAAYEALLSAAPQPQGDAPAGIKPKLLRELLNVDGWQEMQRELLGIENPAEGMK
eukprot:TRINITY_DN61561_c0_g1_i1.p1 TRINITY_DN61561_c0_g1~~TRINITY_DN61561_c0_g1_i1.p1  ORF type:complete len:349 (+),score=113.60 TRINITY_DN61561_c0_g1_i1:56-1102(+)